MKTLILLLLLSFAAAGAKAQSPQRLATQATLHRQQLQAARPPAFRQPVQQRAVVAPAFRQPIIVQRGGGSCGIGRWVDGVFTCQAGPVERALDRLNDTLERSSVEQTRFYSQESVLRAAEARAALAQAKANEKAASDAAYIRAMTPVFAAPAGLGPMPEPTDDGIRRQMAPNGTIIFSNVQ